MESIEAQDLVQQLATGFETLQEEYQKLFGRHEALERQLATARTQYNELSKLCGSASLATPPLSLASVSATHANDSLPSASDLIGLQAEAKVAARQVRTACIASNRLREAKLLHLLSTSTRPALSSEVSNSNICMMPSITESPLEQDFTVEGTPSKLGCPFASMAGKPLSSHAASVLSRYQPGVNAVASTVSTGSPSVHRIDGRASFSSRRASRRGSIADPIKAEICGLSDHRAPEHTEQVINSQPDAQANATDAGVCPIRYLDQHGPEEIATYFEKHKHELPRSHEDCVKRYQSNEAQIRELDSRYGNLVSMIQGLGGIHQPMLPPDVTEADEDTALSGEEADKVRKWASSVSLTPVEVAPVDDNPAHDDASINVGDDERMSHFERPLRDIRVGESPSRPWGITVPARFLEKVAGVSELSSQPAHIESLHDQPVVQTTSPLSDPIDPTGKPRSKGKCPFDFNKLPTGPLPVPKTDAQRKNLKKTELHADGQHKAGVAFLAPEADATPERTRGSSASPPRMLFTGPVFIGCSVEDAARILRESGLSGTGGL